MYSNKYDKYDKYDRMLILIGFETVILALKYDRSMTGRKKKKPSFAESIINKIYINVFNIMCTVRPSRFRVFLNGNIMCFSHMS